MIKGHHSYFTQNLYFNFCSGFRFRLQDSLFNFHLLAIIKSRFSLVKPPRVQELDYFINLHHSIVHFIFARKALLNG
jgi:hypothetical protein